MATAKEQGATARGVVTSPRHLSCTGCRIRVRASAPEIDLLEGSCPICGAALSAESSATGVLGFRSFDLEALSEQHSSDPAPAGAPARPVDLAARRAAAMTRDGFDADRWLDEGGSVSRQAVATQPAAP